MKTNYEKFWHKWSKPIDKISTPKSDEFEDKIKKDAELYYNEDPIGKLYFLSSNMKTVHRIRSEEISNYFTNLKRQFTFELSNLK